MQTAVIFKHLILILLVGASVASAEQIASPGFVETQQFLNSYQTNFQLSSKKVEGDVAPIEESVKAIRSQNSGVSYANSPMTPEEIMCLLRAIKVTEKDARAAAEAFARALNSLKLSSRHFNRTSLMHLLAQSYKESAQFSTLIQKGKVPASKRGYGYIQVTGSENRKEAAQCMAEADPGSEKNVYEFPAITIGRMAYQAALASLCWWKRNIIENPHFPLALTPDTNAAQKLTHLVNAGEINKRITGGEANARERAQIFKKLMLAEPKCRQNQ